MTKLPNRRAILRGAAFSVALPWLEAVNGTRQALAAPPRRRFVVFFSPNGSFPALWEPKGDEKNFTLSPFIAPLAEVQNDIVPIAGLNHTICYVKGKPGDDHDRGVGCLLTNAHMIQPPDPTRKVPHIYGGGISVDQEIANKLKTGTKFSSLQFGVGTRIDSDGSIKRTMLSYEGPGKPLPAVTDPNLMFQRLFSNLAPTTNEGKLAYEALRTERRSILDGVMQNGKALKARLGVEDRQRVEEHETFVRRVEMRLNTDFPVSAGCSRPTEPKLANWMHPTSYPKVFPIQSMLLAHALACNLTDVALLQFTNGGDPSAAFPWLGTTMSHHAMNHNCNHATDKGIPEIQKATAWLAGEMTYLIKLMKSFQEPGGTLLSNSLILWCTDLSFTHRHDNQPIVLAGQAGGSLKTGRFLKYPNRGLGELLVSILNMFGIPATTFGEPEHAKGPLPGLAS